MTAAEHAQTLKDDEAIQRLVASKDWGVYEKYVKEAIANKREVMARAIDALILSDNPEMRKAYFDVRSSVGALEHLLEIPKELRRLVAHNKQAVAERGAEAFSQEGGTTLTDSPADLGPHSKE